MTISEIILSHGDKNDSTSFPYWAIVKKSGHGLHSILAGIWFNRESAERHLESHRYDFGKTAFVYAFSGCNSWHMKEIYAIARAEREREDK